MHVTEFQSAILHKLYYESSFSFSACCFRAALSVDHRSKKMASGRPINSTPIRPKMMPKCLPRRCCRFVPYAMILKPCTLVKEPCAQCRAAAHLDVVDERCPLQETVETRHHLDGVERRSYRQCRSQTCDRDPLMFTIGQRCGLLGW